MIQVFSLSFLSLVLVLNACRDKNKPQEKDIIYLDYAASAPIHPKALHTFIEVSQLSGNASGLNPHAKRLKRLQENATTLIANKIKAQPHQLHFTPNASVSNNIAILGVAYKNPGCHLITSPLEHPSVLNVFHHLETQGYKVTYLKVNREGKVDLDQLQQSLTPQTKLISIQSRNSELGVQQDIQAIGQIAHQHQVLFHTDAAQSFGKDDVDVEALNIDVMTLSGHKIGAPQGIAALYVRDSSTLQPLLFGSGNSLSIGTPPTALICAFGQAVDSFSWNKKKIQKNYEVLTRELQTLDQSILLSYEPSHIVSLAIEGVLLKDLLERLKEYSFSAGCSCLGQDKSHVIAALDPEGQLPDCRIRISFSDQVKPQQLKAFAQKLKDVVDQLRQEKKIGRGCQTLKSGSLDIKSNSLEQVHDLLHQAEEMNGHA